MKWSVRKRGYRWIIFSPDGSMHDHEPTHAGAMDWAYWYALTQALSEPGALAEFRRLKDDADWWRAYLRAVEETPQWAGITALPILPPQPGFTLSEALTCGTCWSGEDDE